MHARTTLDPESRIFSTPIQGIILFVSWLFHHRLIKIIQYSKLPLDPQSNIEKRVSSLLFSDFRNMCNSCVFLYIHFYVLFVLQLFLLRRTKEMSQYGRSTSNNGTCKEHLMRYMIIMHMSPYDTYESM